MFSIHSDPLACLGSQESGGQNIYIRYLCQELDKLGWQTDVFTRWDDANKKQVVNITKHSRVIRLKGGKIGFISKDELFDVLPEIYENFLKFINFQNPYQLFHGHYWDGGWLGVKAHQQFSKPLIENFHSLGIVRMETRKKYARNGEEDEYFVKRLNTENEVVKESSVIICLAEKEKESLCRLYGCPGDKIEVIPGGVDLKHWTTLPREKAREILGLKKDDFVLLYVGRLEWRKGIGTLISASELLSKEIPQLCVLVVGGQIFGRRKNAADFKEYQRLFKLAQDKNVKDLVRFTGRVANRQLPLFYSAADILVVPSYYEPFGLVTLEGMAARVPVVASRVGGLSAIIEDGKNGLLFEPRNPLKLKEKVLLLYQNKGLAEQLAQNGCEDAAKNYSWGQIAQKISNVYKSLITKPLCE